MVKKDIELWKTKGLTTIHLGKGDIMIMNFEPSKDDDKNYSGVLFKNLKVIGGKLKPGQPLNVQGSSFSKIKPDAIITFTDIKSIEVLEHYLKQCKIQLQNRQQ